MRGTSVLQGGVPSRNRRRIFRLGAGLTLALVVGLAGGGGAQTISLEPAPAVGSSFDESEPAMLIRVRLDAHDVVLAEPVRVTLSLPAGTVTLGEDVDDWLFVDQQVSGVVDEIRTASRSLLFTEQLGGTVTDVVLRLRILDDDLPEIDEFVEVRASIEGATNLRASTRYWLRDDDASRDLPSVRFEVPGQPVGYVPLAVPQGGLRLGSVKLVWEGSARRRVTVNLRIDDDAGEREETVTFCGGPPCEAEFSETGFDIFVVVAAGDSAGVEIISVDGALVAAPGRAVVFDSGGESCVAAFFRALMCLALPQFAGEGVCGSPGSEFGTERLSSSADRMLVEDRLSPFRRLRDDVMSTTPTGRYYTALFEDLSPKMIEALLVRPDLLLRVNELEEYWNLAISGFLAGEGDQYPQIESLMLRLERVFETLESTDPTLRAVLGRERERLDLDGFVGLDLDQSWDRVVERGTPEPCQDEQDALCLAGGRFRVEVEWRDFEGNSGRGTARPETDETGMFWFFSPDNVEVIVKVLDGRAINDRWWFFAGALSNVEYTLIVTDTQLGTVRSYANPSGRFASFGDTGALQEVREPAAVQGGVLLEQVLAGTRDRIGRTAARWGGDVRRLLSGFAGGSAPVEKRAAAPLEVAGPAGSCVGSATTLCVGNGRFAIQVDWQDFAGGAGSGRTRELTADTGAFWFFDEQNLELVVKVLDGTGVNGNFWVFYGALSNVGYTLTVTDTVTGASRQYVNALGDFGSVGDTEALPGSG